jgi:hypothetical protein
MVIRRNSKSLNPRLKNLKPRSRSLKTQAESNGYVRLALLLQEFHQGEDLFCRRLFGRAGFKRRPQQHWNVSGRRPKAEPGSTLSHSVLKGEALARVCDFGSQGYRFEPCRVQVP